MRVWKVHMRCAKGYRESTRSIRKCVYRKQLELDALYLRWHRDQHYPVAARIRVLLPRFKNLSDREVLARSFRLSVTCR
jgi:hypothetical protein